MEALEINNRQDEGGFRVAAIYSEGRRLSPPPPLEGFTFKRIRRSCQWKNTCDAQGLIRYPNGVVLAIVVAAALGVGLAWWRTAALNRQAASGAAQAVVARREHAAEVFSRTVGQIGSDRLEVRMGAIVSLAALRRDFPELSQSVLDVFLAYSRTRSEDFEADEPDLDVAAIINILQTSIQRE